MQSGVGYAGAAVDRGGIPATADLSALLGQLNESPLHDDLWSPVLKGLCEITQSRSGFLCTGDNPTVLVVDAEGADGTESPARVTRYSETYPTKDPFRQPVLQSGRTGVVDGEDLLPNAGLLRTELYRDRLQPRGLRYSMFVVTAANTERIEALSLWRTASQGQFREESKKLLELLYPHIQKSMELRHVLRTTQLRLAGLEVMLDVNPTATFLVTKRGHLLHHNAAAKALLKDSDVLNLENGTLTAASVQARDALRSLLQNAVAGMDRPASTSADTTIAVQTKSNRTPIYLHAAPLTTADRRRSRADVMLIVCDPGNPMTVQPEVMASIYGLTPALSDVANGLLRGYSLEQIAEQRQVSIGTVRQQLKSILNRTGTVRQSDLVRLLLSLPRKWSENSARMPHVGHAKTDLSY